MCWTWTWPLQPPSCSSLAAVTPVPTAGSWKESALQPQEPWVLAVLTQERGLGSALAQRCLQLLHMVWHLGQVMLIPHLKQHGQGHTTTPTQPRAPGQRTTGLDLRCPLLHICHLSCSLSCARGGGRHDSWWRKHDPECSPTPSHAVEIKQCLKSSGFTSLFLRAAKDVDSPCRAFPVAGTLVGAPVMSQFRLKRNPIGTSLLKATS